MKTLEEVLKENADRAALIQAVVDDIGRESIQDVINHGIDGGFNGFIYYTDTIAFYQKHRDAINSWVKDMADDLGENPVEMVGGFGCLKWYDHKAGKWTEPEGRDKIGVCIYGGSIPENDTKDGDFELVQNALAWFAAEEVCRLFED